MATLIQSYEQQYSVLTADVTAKIGRLKVGNEGETFMTLKALTRFYYFRRNMYYIKHTLYCFRQS